MHMVSISTEHDFSPGSDQMEWLAGDLARAAGNRAAVPWVAMSIHRPMYCTKLGEADLGNQFQVAMEPLMVQYDVDIVI
jgi:hypothetical protein